MVDPVQSIRVASALATRLGVLVRSPTTARGEAAVGRLELAIGEARQIHPEIWRHLDDARAELVARGVDTSEFDNTRATELATFGVTHIETWTVLYTAALHTAPGKSATFDVAGHVRAVAACRALMAAMPEIDWAELERNENAEIARAGSLGPSRTAHIVIGSLIAGAAVVVAIAIYLYATQRFAPRDEARDTSPSPGLTSLDIPPPLEAPRPSRPGCSDDAIAHAQARLGRRFGLVIDGETLTQCRGGQFASGERTLPGLAIVLAAHTAAGRSTTVRGIATTDGNVDILDFTPTPVDVDALAIADLDGDGRDELVLATARGLAIARVRDGKLVDVAGPPVTLRAKLRDSCTGNLDGTTADGRTRLVVDVDDDATGSGCPSPGRHTYMLDGDKLVEQR